MIRGIRDACRRLADYPLIGHRSEELEDPTALVWTFDDFSIIYDPGDSVRVHRILGRGMDLSRALERADRREGPPR